MDASFRAERMMARTLDVYFSSWKLSRFIPFPPLSCLPALQKDRWSNHASLLPAREYIYIPRLLSCLQSSAAASLVHFILRLVESKLQRGHSYVNHKKRGYFLFRFSFCTKSGLDIHRLLSRTLVTFSQTILEKKNVLLLCRNVRESHESCPPGHMQTWRTDCKGHTAILRSMVFYICGSPDTALQAFYRAYLHMHK